MRSICAAILLSSLSSLTVANDLFLWSEGKSKAQSALSSKSNHFTAFNNGKSFALNNNALLRYKVGDAITINLSANEIYQANITRLRKKANGVNHIIAKINVDNESLPVIITLGPKQFFMRIVTPNGVQVAQGKNNHGQLIHEKLLTPQGTLTNDAKLPQQSPLYKKRIKSLTQKSPSPTNKKALSSNSHSTTQSLTASIQNNNDTATVNVLFVYSLTAEALYDGDITTRLNHIVEVTNQIYIDSEVNMQINIADTLAVDYADDAIADEALDAITYQEGEAFANIESLRYESGADMVSLLRPFIDGDTACGLAWANSSIYGSIDFMYSHTSIDCGDYVNAHELGHNMGLAHSRAQGDEGYTYPFALGYQHVDDLNGFSTVMAYETFNADKVYKFSNPNILCTEVSCGIDRNDPVNGADASYALNQVRFQLQNIMDDEPNYTLASDALANITDFNLKNCLENLITNNNVHYASQLRTVFCNYMDISSLAGLESFQGITSAYLDGNNLADLSPLSSLSKISTLLLNSSNISDITALSNITSLNRVNLSNNNISDLSPLSSLVFLSTLNLDNNQLSSLTGLENLNSLTHLYLNNNQINNLSPINNLVSLETLQLENNAITNILPLNNLTNISWLSLSNNSINDLSPLIDFNQLEYLYAQSNNISSISSLSGNSSLAYIDVSNNRISQLGDLSKLNSLTELTLEGNQISDLAALSSASKLTVLNLTNNQITNGQPISYLSTLTHLYIANNPLTQLTWLSELKQLELLAIDQTNTDDLTPIEALINLRNLSISNNPITDITSIAKLYYLESLYSPNTNISDISPIFSLHNVWNEFSFTGNNNIYCWQIDYLKTFVDYESLSEPSRCNTSDDNNDMDGDGLTNIAELVNNTNPLYHNSQTGSVRFQLEEVTIAEADIDLAFKLVRIEGATGQFSVDINTNSLTANAGNDFKAIQQTITFADGELFKSAKVTLLDDSINDNGEQFEIVLSNPQGTTLRENKSFIVTLTDDDAAFLNWSSAYQEVTENSSTAIVTLTRPNSAEGEMSVDVGFLDYTAINGVDYTFNNQSINFVEGEYSKDIHINIIDNNQYQGDRGFYLEMTNPVNALIDQRTNNTFIQIIDDETPPIGEVTFESSAFSINENAGELEVKVVRVNGNHGDLFIDYTLSMNGATQGSDFNLPDGQLHFLSTDFEKIITIPIIDDNTDESDESFAITLSSNTSGIIGQIDQTTITIVDNDDPAVVTPPTSTPEKSSGGGGAIVYLLGFLLCFLPFRQKDLKVN